MGRSSLVTRGGGGWSGDHRTGFMILALVALLCRLDATLAESLSPDTMDDAATPRNAPAGPHYRNNLELEEALRNFTQRCSHISKLYSIGNSTLGVPLWALEISDKPGVSEPEPAFKATLIVDKLHLHLLPSMNPDGFAAKPNPMRNNAQNVDLNRDFPDQYFPANNNEGKRQPETRAIMNWIRAVRFTASASFHEGALVANYPYDGNLAVNQNCSVSPDNSTFRYLAGLYANNHPSMSKSKEFVGGVTNGAKWYPLYGGMQDWNYLHGNCLELTLEMNENKWPPPIKISQLWSEHRKSMLELVLSTVTITASGEFGDYHRLLAPGRIYEVTSSMAGYYKRSTSVFLPNRTALALDFILDPLPTATGDSFRSHNAISARARLRGHSLFDEEKLSVMIPPNPPKFASGKTPSELELKIPGTVLQTQLVEMVSWKPTKIYGNGVHLDDDSGFALPAQYHPTYVFSIASVLAILIWLFYASRSSYRQRQKIPSL
uniref:Peptidase M14 domain-containing protein n=1 Tax=Physcomitrium patens TaxID=3218 RepID=A0A2K1KFC2_PHYPA|nr:hypothetical protein PHYPA_008850 [Physcomitrium patens]